MKHPAMPWALVLLLAVPANVVADDGKESRVRGTISLWGGNTPAIDLFIRTSDVVGPRIQLDVLLGQGHDWSVSPGFSYGYSNLKVEQVASPPTPASTDRLIGSYWDAIVDFLYHKGGGDEAGLFGGPGLFYSSLTITEKQTGSNDVTYHPYQTFGAQLTVGGRVPVGSRMGLTAGMTERVGMTGFDDKASFGETKFSAVSHSTHFSVGLQVRF